MTAKTATVAVKNILGLEKGIMMKEKVYEELNKQVNMEIYSAYLYLSMATYFDAENLKGFSHWMKMQYEEEMEHAMKIYDYLYDQGQRVILTQINAPQSKWESPLFAFEDAYSHEQLVTSLINRLVDLVVGEKDHEANVFLQWFVTEQVEEEATADGVVQKLKLIGSSAKELLSLDRELAQRK